MKRSYYSIQSLGSELAGLERRYGMPSQTFYYSYRADRVPGDVSGFDRVAWASIYEELMRLSDAPRSRTSQPSC